ncbi:MAG TPA: prepilin-type N-terminal cleavage/methylation domain-containing protein [Phycisphaerales bacterium]|nr:prepilin-type N-terminal cleavage/methylation domain-containing protein [Phycisphaerales bacterium]
MITAAHPTRPRRAFTLMEVVATLVILGVGLPALITAVREATVRRASVQQQIVARWLVCEKLEDITADRHSSTRGWSYIASANYPAEAAVNGFTTFARTVAITETGPDLVSAGTGYRTVTVTVTYRDARDGAKALSIATVLTDYDQ